MLLIIIELVDLPVDLQVISGLLIYQKAAIWFPTFTETSKVFAKTFAMNCIACLDFVCANKFVWIHFMQLTNLICFILFRLLVFNANVEIVVVPVLFLYLQVLIGQRLSEACRINFLVGRGHQASQSACMHLVHVINTHLLLTRGIKFSCIIKRSKKFRLVLKRWLLVVIMRRHPSWRSVRLNIASVLTKHTSMDLELGVRIMVRIFDFSNFFV